MHFPEILACEDFLHMIHEVPFEFPKGRLAKSANVFQITVDPVVHFVGKTVEHVYCAMKRNTVPDV